MKGSRIKSVTVVYPDNMGEIQMRLSKAIAKIIIKKVGDDICTLEKIIKTISNQSK